MIDRMGRIKGFLAAGMVAAVLLSGCGSTTTDPLASSEILDEDQTAQETEAQELEKQLIAILNLDRDEDSQVASDVSLSQAADFFLDYVLQDPQSYWEKEQPVDLDGLLDQKATDAFVYDGSLPAVQVGTAFLAELKDTVSTGTSLAYQQVKNLSVVYGEGEKGSAWVILVSYDFLGQINPPEQTPSEDETGESTGGSSTGEDSSEEDETQENQQEQAGQDNQEDDDTTT